MDEVSQKIEKFFSNYNKYKFEKGTILLKPGQTPSGIFCLVAGTVKMYAVSSNGEELVLNTFKPVSFFPVAFALNSALSNYYFETIDSTEVYKAPPQDFLKFLQSEPDVALNLLSRIYKGLDGLFLRMEYSMAGSASKRLITEILISAKRFGKKNKKDIIINLKLTEKDLAAFSGITRETVSRELQKLEKKDLLTYKKGVITIKDLKLLEAELFS